MRLAGLGKRERRRPAIFRATTGAEAYTDPAGDRRSDSYRAFCWLGSMIPLIYGVPVLLTPAVFAKIWVLCSSMRSLIYAY